MKKIIPNDQVLPTVWNFGDWTINFVKAGMLNTAEIESFSSIIKVKRIPDVFYGYNVLSLINQKHDFLYKVDPVESVRLCTIEERKSKDFLSTDGGKKVEDLKAAVSENNKKCSEKKEVYNPINAIPEIMLAKQSETWMKRDFSKIKDFQKTEVTDDWTYTTPYKGSVHYLSKSPVRNFKSTIPPAKSMIITEPTNDQIPFHKLGQDNPVKSFDEILLFEDDLDDLGFAQSLVRIRVMADSFYMLLRNYIRADGLVIRINDTRLYHAFGSEELIREFQFKESTYESLKASGFGFESEWILNPNQSDIIFPKLQLKTKFMDRILI